MRGSRSSVLASVVVIAGGALVGGSLDKLIRLVVATLLAFVYVPIFVGGLKIRLCKMFTVISMVKGLGVFTGLKLGASLVGCVSRRNGYPSSRGSVFSSLLVVKIVVVPVAVLTFVLGQFLLVSMLGVPVRCCRRAGALLFSLLVSGFLLVMKRVLATMLSTLRGVCLAGFTRLVCDVVC